MSYQMSFSGSLSFPSAAHLNAGLDALFLGGEQLPLLSLEALSSPRHDQLCIDYSCSAPASAWDPELERIKALTSYACDGWLQASYDGDLVEQLSASATPTQPQAKATSRWTAYFALLNGDHQALEQRLNEGDDPNEVYPFEGDLRGESLLWRAVEADDLVGMRLLLERGAATSWQRMGTPMLSIAMSTPAQDLLLGAGATIDDDTFTQGWWIEPELLLRLLTRATALRPETYQRISLNALLAQLPQVLELLEAQDRFSLDDEQREDARQQLEEAEEDEDAQALLAWLDAH